MENSFFEFRNETNDVTMVSSCDSDEVIDNSVNEEESFIAQKKLPLKNQTVAVVAESEESGSDEEEKETQSNVYQRESYKGKQLLRRSSIVPVTISSSEIDEHDDKIYDDTPKRGDKPLLRRSSINMSASMSRNESDTNTRRLSNMSTFNQAVLTSSSSEDEGSPELVPRRRPVRSNQISSPKTVESPNSESPAEESFIGRRRRKVMVLKESDSDHDPSIEEEYDEDAMVMSAATRMSILGVRPKDMDSDESDIIQSDEDSSLKSRESISHASSTNSLNDLPDVTISPKNTGDNIHKYPVDDKDMSLDNIDNNAGQDETVKLNDSNLNDTMEDLSRLNDSEVVNRTRNRHCVVDLTKIDADFEKSPERNLSHASSTNSLDNLPEVTIAPNNASVCNADDSKLSCSTFGSPVHDVSMDMNNSIEMDTKDNTPKSNKKKVHNRSRNSALIDLTNVMMEDDDDEVKVIDSKPEVIDIISSDDEYYPKLGKVSPNPNKSTKRLSNNEKSPKNNNAVKAEPVSVSKPKKTNDSTMKQYLLPKSYPNQGVVYVKKHVKERESNELQRLRMDLLSVKTLLDKMDLNTLPDGGVKLVEKLSKLEQEVHIQEEKVAAMIVEPDGPTNADSYGIDSKEEKGLTWDDIQKASNQVQPRMFGKQAMATHVAERGLMLQRLRDLHSALASRPAEAESAPQPAALRTALMPHQLHALAWLRWRETQRPRGGVLADDMGLGKTITMLSLVVTSKDEKLDEDESSNNRDKENTKLVPGGTLVVCPASLLQQWAAEAEAHCARALSLLQHHGPSRARLPALLASADLVLTTYHILQRDAEKNGVLMKIKWHRVILDEAHIVRNHKSATSLAVSALNGTNRWCLTGTPVQNKDLDIFALLKFLKCTPFDDLTMWKKWIDNKTLGGQERLSTIMRCLLLRRTKEQLQQRGQLNCLPQRTMHHIEVSLTKEEMNVYQKVLVFSKTLFAQFLHQRAEKQADMEGGFLPKQSGKDDPYAKMHKKMVALHGAKPVKSHEILVLLLRLRQLCCHCGLIAGMLEGSDEADVSEDMAGLDLLSELNKLSIEEDDSRRKSGKGDVDDDDRDTGEQGTTAAEAIRSVLSLTNPVFNMGTVSSKIEAVVNCLNENVFSTKDEKAVVVSQWTSVLALVGRSLGQSRCATLSGAVPVARRAAVVRDFNAAGGARVLLLSLCAGGVGLNLCGASHLLLLDPHWNPQLEQQAQDRVYRVGQLRDVHIYRFTCLETVEQSIRKLQEHKLELAESVLTGARHNTASKLSIEDLKILFNMGQ